MSGKKPWCVSSPCDNCPFLKEGGIRLREGRLHEISSTLLSSQGGTFPCHKTTEIVENHEGEEVLGETKNSQQCAGAIIYALKNGNMTQMMRIMSRTGGFDPEKMLNSPMADKICGSPMELLEANGFEAKDCCCVCDDGCKLPANYADFDIVPFDLPSCYACGLAVCASCSQERKFIPRGKKRKVTKSICNTCIADFDKHVMAPWCLTP